jgi:hypothetical protein
MVGMALTVVQTTAAIAQAPQEDCAAPTPELVAECWDRQPAAPGAHGGMAPGTAPMCGDYLVQQVMLLGWHLRLEKMEWL